MHLKVILSAGKKPFLYGILAVSCMAVLSSPAAASPTEEEVLVRLVDSGILPTVEKLHSSARSLGKATTDLCLKKDENSLAHARHEWMNLDQAWAQALPFLFGPADRLALEKRIGTLPVNATVLEAVVSQPDMADLAKSDDVRGIAAAEYLLFSRDSAAESASAMRCSYMQSVTEEIESLTGELEQAWKGDLAEKFKHAGDGNPFLFPSDAFSFVVSESLNVTEILLRDRIAVASNFFQPQSKPDYLPSWRSKTTTESLLANIEGLKLALTSGESDKGLTELVGSRDGVYSRKNPSLASGIHRQLDKIEGEIQSLAGKNGDIYTKVKNNPKALKPLYNQLQILQDQIVEASLVLELDVQSPGEVQ